MQSARIAELLQPFLSPCHFGERGDEESAVLSQTQLHSISTYIDILLHWSARINLTAIRDPEEIVTRHFGESLFAARHLFPTTAHVGTAALGCPAERSSADREGRDFSRADSRLEKGIGALAPGGRAARLADVGSGAGFPGLPIKLWAPNIALTLIESNQKKATFLHEVSRALKLTKINIQNARAETLTPSTFDVVTLRAVERFPDVLPVAAALLTSSGRLALLIASSQLDQARSSLPHLFWQPPIPVPESRSRLLLVGTQEPA